MREPRRTVKVRILAIPAITFSFDIYEIASSLIASSDTLCEII